MIWPLTHDRGRHRVWLVASAGVPVLTSLLAGLFHTAVIAVGLATGFSGLSSSGPWFGATEWAEFGEALIANLGNLPLVGLIFGTLPCALMLGITSLITPRANDGQKKLARPFAALGGIWAGCGLVIPEVMRLPGWLVFGSGLIAFALGPVLSIGFALAAPMAGWLCGTWASRWLRRLRVP